MTEAFILSAVRTPIGKFKGGLATVRPDDLATLALHHAMDRIEGSREAVQEVCFGATNQAGEDNRNVGRMAALLAGLPFEVTGVTLNRLCGSGMDAIVSMARAIRCNDVDVAVAGGVESMTRAPYVMAKSSESYSRSVPMVHDTTIGWRFSNPRMAQRIPLESMGETAENVAERFGISRQDQDAFAHASHQRASTAQKTGRFDDEIVPVPVISNSKRGIETLFCRDENIRESSSIDTLAALRPVFRSDGTVTAGNSSSLNDGAAALLLASERWATQHEVRPLARIVAWSVAGVDPSIMGTGPIPAVRNVLSKAGLTLHDIDIIELNEAFASQALACIRELSLDTTKVNINGGAIALGHPIGCSGARIVVTLCHILRQRQLRYGLATLCVGVGQGMAVIVENLQ